VIYSQTFGYTDYKTRIPITDTSEFQLGSASKQFTAVTIMMLKERGLLNYDDLVTKYFPDFPYPAITIKMLLDHRSGLPNYMYTCSAESNDKTCLMDNMQVMESLSKNKPQCCFKPDHLFNYCNTNYAILAAIVEKITGMPFAGFISKNVFTPLGMTHTHIYSKYDTVIPCKVTGYNQNFSRSGYDFLDGVAGDKGIYSTTTDLLKWDQALYGDKILKQSTLKDAYIPYTRWMGGRSYGFGWRLLLMDKDTIIYHGGWWHGFNCDFIRDVKHHYTIIALSNHVNWCVNKSSELLTLFRNCEKNMKSASSAPPLSDANTSNGKKNGSTGSGN
jgi:CubicO group peptidase (beta-lactamase class C family)